MTFLGGLLGNYLIQKAQRKVESESLASAFYGEITASLLAIERRQYIQLLTEELERIRKEGKAEFSYFEGKSETFDVYEKNVEKIGLLPAPLPEKIILFYGIMTAVLDDLTNLNKLRSEGHKISVIERYFQDLINDISGAVQSGKDVQSLIRAKFKPKIDT